MGRITDRRSVLRINTSPDASPDGGAAPGSAAGAAPVSVSVVRRMDTLAGEEPLEIRVGRRDHNGEVHRRPLAVTMRTPGDDVDLALGFLFTEGLIGDAAD